MKKLLFLAAIVTSALWLSGAQAKQNKEPLRLSATSKWVADYEKDGCRLIRRFGEGENQVIISFNRYGPGERFRLTLAGLPFRLKQNDNLALQFGPGEAEQKVGFMVGEQGENIPALILDSIRLSAPTKAEQMLLEKWKPGEELVLTPMGVEREKAVSYLLASSPLSQPVLLQLGKMDRPLAALNQCIDDLMTNWGIDVEKHKNLSKSVAPLSNPGNWINTSDYPLKMLRQGQPALVDFRMDIDETGKATACHIQQTTRPMEFDQAVCRSLMKRAEFSPAFDAGGMAIRSYWKNTVRFQLPGY